MRSMYDGIRKQNSLLSQNSIKVVLSKINHKHVATAHIHSSGEIPVIITNT